MAAQFLEGMLAARGIDDPDQQKALVEQVLEEHPELVPSDPPIDTQPEIVTLVAAVEQINEAADSIEPEPEGS